MADYVDCMDPSRVVRPVQSTKKGVECKVFWRERVGDREVRISGGTTFIPQNLFLTGEEREGTQRRAVGFLPEGKAAALPAKVRKSRKAPKRQDDRDEDYEVELRTFNP